MVLEVDVVEDHLAVDVPDRADDHDPRAAGLCKRSVQTGLVNSFLGRPLRGTDAVNSGRNDLRVTRPIGALDASLSTSLPVPATGSSASNENVALSGRASRSDASAVATPAGPDQGIHGPDAAFVARTVSERIQPSYPLQTMTPCNQSATQFVVIPVGRTVQRIAMRQSTNVKHREGGE